MCRRSCVLSLVGGQTDAVFFPHSGHEAKSKVTTERFKVLPAVRMINVILGYVTLCSLVDVQ